MDREPVLCNRLALCNFLLKVRFERKLDTRAPTSAGGRCDAAHSMTTAVHFFTNISTNTSDGIAYAASRKNLVAVRAGMRGKYIMPKRPVIARCDPHLP